MENNMIETDENEAEKATATFTKIIDGRSFVVRIFLPIANAETMQEKIERMLHRDIVNTICQSTA